MAGSRNSSRSRNFELLAAFLLLALLSAGAAAWFHRHGYTLYYGDAEAHLNMARRVVDSRQPGTFQLGGVWLPLPHLLMLPLVASDTLWRNALAGVIPVATSFVIGCLFLFSIARRLYGDTAAAAATLAVFALNPNLLYLQSAPMTEPVFFAAVCGLVYFAMRFRESQSLVWAAAAGVAATAAAMTRYDGWFLIPFVAAFFFFSARRRRWLPTLVFGAIASSGPLAWLAHNWWYWGDFLEFYHGPYSARAIYQRQLDAGMARYRGDHNWRDAWLYYTSAVRLTVGWPVVILGVAGCAAAAIKRTFAPLLLLLPAPLFFIWSTYSGTTPIFLPHLWPFSYYNSRYGLAALPLLALGAGALVTLVRRRRGVVALLVAGLAVAPWLLRPTKEAWICWKESEVNSVVRRDWTHQVAEFLAAHYRTGTGIFIPFGDVCGAFREAGIPLREALHEDIVPWWHAAAAKPAYFLHEEWAIANTGDKISDALVRSLRDGPRYDCLKTVSFKGGPVIQIYRRR